MEVYAEDSISFRTKQDFNFYADRDINMEAGRNFNIKVHGEMHTHVLADQVLIVDANQKIHVKSALNETIGAGYKLTVTGDNDVNASGSIKHTSGGTNETKAGGNIIETGSQIHMNGPGAATAATAAIPEPLTTHTLADMPTQDASATEGVDVIVRRMPTAEPYPHHENLDPLNYKPEILDRDKDGRYSGSTSDMSEPAAAWKTYSTITDTFAKVAPPNQEG